MSERGPKPEEANHAKWPAQDALFHIVTKGIYGNDMSDNLIEELRKQKFGEVIISKEARAQQKGLVEKIASLGYSSEKVQTRMDNVFKPLTKDERTATEFTIGLYEAHVNPDSDAEVRLNRPTPEKIADKMKISTHRVNELITSALTKLAPQKNEA